MAHDHDHNQGTHRIRKVVVATGIITTYAGTGAQSYYGDGGYATYAYLNLPYGLVLDKSGNLYIADMQNHIIRFVKYSTGIITKYAGTAYTAGSTGDYGAANSAYLFRPRGVALDSLNNLYIADTDNNRIRVVNAVTNIIMTVAGAVLTGGYGGDFQLGTTTSAALKNPYGIVYDPWLNCMYIADSTNNRIRVLTSNGMLYTVAGSGVSGTSGDSGPPLAARLNNPLAIAVDTNGNVYIGDTNNNVIRQIVYNPNLGLSTCVPGEYSCATTPSGCCTCPTGSYCINYLTYQCPINTYNAMMGGASAAACLACPSYMAAAAGSTACSYLVNTIAGTGLTGSAGDDGPATVAMLNQPAAAVMDKSGNMYISSTGSGMIQKIKNFATSKGANQIITHIAGNLNGYNAVTDGVAASSAYLASPFDIDVDLSGNVYVANTYYNNVKMISVVDGSISTVAGFVSNAGGGYSGDGVQATSSYLYMPFGLFVDVSANIYIGDTYNHRIRFVNAVTKIITTVAGRSGAGFGGDGGSATSAYLYYPRGICLDSSGRLYIADTANSRIRVVINGIISTLAGKNGRCFPPSIDPLSLTPVSALHLFCLIMSLSVRRFRHLWLRGRRRQTDGCVALLSLGRGSRQMGQRVLHGQSVQCGASHKHNDYQQYRIRFILKCALHWRRGSGVVSKVLFPAFSHDGPCRPSLVHWRFGEQCDSQHFIVAAECVSAESLSGWPSMV